MAKSAVLTTKQQKKLSSLDNKKPSLDNKKIVAKRLTTEVYQQWPTNSSDTFENFQSNPSFSAFQFLIFLSKAGQILAAYRFIPKYLQLNQFFTQITRSDGVIFKYNTLPFTGDGHDQLTLYEMGLFITDLAKLIHNNFFSFLVEQHSALSIYNEFKIEDLPYSENNIKFTLYQDLELRRNFTLKNLSEAATTIIDEYSKLQSTNIDNILEKAESLIDQELSMGGDGASLTLRATRPPTREDKPVISTSHSASNLSKPPILLDDYITSQPKTSDAGNADQLISQNYNIQRLRNLALTLLSQQHEQLNGLDRIRNNADINAIIDQAIQNALRRSPVDILTNLNQPRNRLSLFRNIYQEIRRHEQRLIAKISTLGFKITALDKDLDSPEIMQLVENPKVISLLTQVVQKTTTIITPKQVSKPRDEIDQPRQSQLSKGSTISSPLIQFGRQLQTDAHSALDSEKTKKELKEDLRKLRLDPFWIERSLKTIDEIASQTSLHPSVISRMTEGQFNKIVGGRIPSHMTEEQFNKIVEGRIPHEVKLKIAFYVAQDRAQFYQKKGVDPDFDIKHAPSYQEGDVPDEIIALALLEREYAQKNPQLARIARKANYGFILTPDEQEKLGEQLKRDWEGFDKKKRRQFIKVSLMVRDDVPKKNPLKKIWLGVKREYVARRLQKEEHLNTVLNRMDSRLANLYKASPSATHAAFQRLVYDNPLDNLYSLHQWMSRRHHLNVDSETELNMGRNIRLTYKLLDSMFSTANTSLNFILSKRAIKRSLDVAQFTINSLIDRTLMQLGINPLRFRGFFRIPSRVLKGIRHIVGRVFQAPIAIGKEVMKLTGSLTKKAVVNSAKAGWSALKLTSKAILSLTRTIISTGSVLVGTIASTLGISTSMVVIIIIIVVFVVFFLLKLFIGDDTQFSKLKNFGVGGGSLPIESQVKSSKYLSIEKIAKTPASCPNNKCPEPVDFTVSADYNLNITLNEFEGQVYSVSITSITDQMEVRYNTQRYQDDGVDVPNITHEPRILDKDENDFEELNSDISFEEINSDIQAAQTNNSKITINYPFEFDSQYNHSLVQNRVTVDFQVYDPEKDEVVSDYVTALENIFFGDHPEEIGCWPAVGSITQWPYQSDGISHKKIDAYDIANSVGTAIYAPFSGEACAGVITRKTNMDSAGGYGVYVKLTASEPIQGITNRVLVFGHLHEHYDFPYLEVGESHCKTVSQGDKIGYMGATGWSTGSHLHYELQASSGSKDNSVLKQIMNTSGDVVTINRYGKITNINRACQ